MKSTRYCINCIFHKRSLVFREHYCTHPIVLERYKSLVTGSVDYNREFLCKHQRLGVSSLNYCGENGSLYVTTKQERQ